MNVKTWLNGPRVHWLASFCVQLQGKNARVVLTAMGMFLGQVERLTGGSDRSEVWRLIEAAMDHHVKP